MANIDCISQEPAGGQSAQKQRQSATILKTMLRVRQQRAGRLEGWVIFLVSSCDSCCFDFSGFGARVWMKWSQPVGGWATWFPSKHQSFSWIMENTYESKMSLTVSGSMVCFPFKIDVTAAVAWQNPTQEGLCCTLVFYLKCMCEKRKARWDGTKEFAVPMWPPCHSNFDLHPFAGCFVCRDLKGCSLSPWRWR